MKQRRNFRFPRKLLGTGTSCTFNTCNIFVYCNAKSLKRPLPVFSVWISCLIKDLSAFCKAHLVLILDPEKYRDLQISQVSHPSQQNHEVSWEVKIHKWEEKTQIKKNIILFWNHFLKLFYTTVKFWYLLSFKMGRDSHEITQYNATQCEEFES